MTKQNIITQKLQNGNFKKNTVYSSVRISEILKLTRKNCKNGDLKKVLTTNKKWKYLHGRTWQYVGDTNDALIVKKSTPIVKKTAPIKEIGLIRKFIKWIY